MKRKVNFLSTRVTQNNEKTNIGTILSIHYTDVVLCKNIFHYDPYISVYRIVQGSPTYGSPS